MKVRKEDMPKEPEQPEKMSRDQLKVLALKQRIGEITSEYEEKIADIRAFVTQFQEQHEEIIRNNEREMQALQAQLRTYQENEALQAEDLDFSPED